MNNDEQHDFIAEQDKEVDELGDECKMKKFYQKKFCKLMVVFLDIDEQNFMMHHPGADHYARLMSKAI
jgi:hypothetical protein